MVRLDFGKVFYRTNPYCLGMLENDPRVPATFSILGPVRAWRRDGQELDLGSRQQRTILAMLLLHEGAVATLDELIVGIWGDEPPRSAVTTIRTYVSRLRAIFGGADPDQAVRLNSVAGGYSLQIPADALDLPRFRQHTARAAEAARRGDWRAAAAELHAALDLWHGQPLTGTLGPYVQGQRVRLQQLGAAARIDLISAQIKLGQHRAVLPELAAMVDTHPLWEDVQALYMTALYGCGRVAEALAHYRHARKLLVQDLGIEPGARLRDVHRRILAGDPSLIAVPARPALRSVRERTRPSVLMRGRHHSRISRRRLPQ